MEFCGRWYTNSPGRRFRRIAINSAWLGLEVALGLTAVVWLASRDTRPSVVAGRPARLDHPFAPMPPLVPGAGILALPWLALLAGRSLGDSGPWRYVAVALEDFARFIDPDRSGWILLVISVGLTLFFAVGTTMRNPGEPCASSISSAYEAARLAGMSRSRSRRLSRPGQGGRWIGLFIVAAAMAATNLSPALLFTRWADGRTVAPGVLSLADSSADAQAQAAALALCAIAVNLGALGVAWATGVRRRILT